MKQEVMAERLANREYLQDHAHIWLAPATFNLNPEEDVFKKFGDMNLVAGLFEERENQCSWKPLKYHMLEVMPGKSPTEKYNHFFDAARMNLKRAAKIFPLEKDLCKLISLVSNDSTEKDFGDGEMPIVATTKTGIMGSGIMVALAEEIKDHIGDFLILPSSIHETILVPFRMFGTAPEDVSLKNEIRILIYLLKAINNEAVIPEDRLSDSVMVYYNGVFQKVDEKMK